MTILPLAMRVAAELNSLGYLLADRRDEGLHLTDTTAGTVVRFAYDSGSKNIEMAKWAYADLTNYGHDVTIRDDMEMLVTR